MNRQEKAQIIEQFHEKAARANIAVVTDFKGMTVEEMTDLRAKCYEAGVDFQVVKNTLARLALKDTDHGELSEHLKDNCAFALGYEDPVALAKVLTDFAKTSKKFELKFGCLEGKYLDADGIKELSKMPTKPELLSSVLGTMQAVPRNFVSLFANIERKFLYALVAIKDQKEQGEAA
ncbi:50S ribosomal protein L10 [Pseudodesulfovibrio senegalensis]|jgi:large subunit ribosomal protein L10|uniref:Large ribosomal subunit protein uL10 n=1 Tax=Pseudodesulfovibrio senegalensis TaxID=1721087 RepID=A0A6N6N507_9BACT|nr:50S ribosomal protein L10 [Pseudodesulfovibrio senegalensis]KAB1442318.1 50S ribosomal protein L10 [Pseudodesulfovibrio senegalensis]